MISPAIRFFTLFVSLTLFANSLGAPWAEADSSGLSPAFTSQALEAPGTFFQAVFSLIPRVSVSHAYATLGPDLPSFPLRVQETHPAREEVYFAEGPAESSSQGTPPEPSGKPTQSIKGVVAFLTEIHLNDQVSEALLALRGIKPGQSSFHIGSGVSMMPVAEALLGAKVLAIDKDSTMPEAVHVFLRNINIGDLAGKSGGSFHYEENNWVSLRGPFDHITAIGIYLSEIKTEIDAHQFAEWILNNVARSGSVLFSIGIPHRGTALVLEALKALGATFDAQTVERLIDYYLEPVWLLKNVRTVGKSVSSGPLLEEGAAQREARIRLMLSALNDLRHLYFDPYGTHSHADVDKIVEAFIGDRKRTPDIEIREFLEYQTVEWEKENTRYDERLAVLSEFSAVIQSLSYGAFLPIRNHEWLATDEPTPKANRSTSRYKATPRETNAFLEDFLHRLRQAENPEHFQSLFLEIKGRLSLDAQDLLEQDLIERISRRHSPRFFENLVGCAIFIGEQTQRRPGIFKESVFNQLHETLAMFNDLNQRPTQAPLSLTTLFSYALSPVDHGAALPRILAGLIKLPTAYRDRFVAFHLQQLAWHGDDFGYDTSLAHILLKTAFARLNDDALSHETRESLELGIAMALVRHDSPTIRRLIEKHAETAKRVVLALYHNELRTGLHITSIKFLLGTKIIAIPHSASLDSFTLSPWEIDHRDDIDGMRLNSDWLESPEWTDLYARLFGRLGIVGEDPEKSALTSGLGPFDSEIQRQEFLSIAGPNHHEAIRFALEHGLMPDRFARHVRLLQTAEDREMSEDVLNLGLKLEEAETLFLPLQKWGTDLVEQLLKRGATPIILRALERAFNAEDIEVAQPSLLALVDHALSLKIPWEDFSAVIPKMAMYGQAALDGMPAAGIPWAHAAAFLWWQQADEVTHKRVQAYVQQGASLEKLWLAFTSKDNGNSIDRARELGVPWEFLREINSLLEQGLEPFVKKAIQLETPWKYVPYIVQGLQNDRRAYHLIKTYRESGYDWEPLIKVAILNKNWVQVVEAATGLAVPVWSVTRIAAAMLEYDKRSVLRSIRTGVSWSILLHATVAINKLRGSNAWTRILAVGLSPELAIHSATALPIAGMRHIKRILNKFGYNASLPPALSEIPAKRYEEIDAFLGELADRLRGGESISKVALRKEALRQHAYWNGMKLFENLFSTNDELTSSYVDAYRQEIERSQRLQRFQAEQRLNLFGLRFEILPAYSAEKPHRIGIFPDTLEWQRIERDGNVSAIEMWHHPGALAFAEFQVVGNAVLVETLQSEFDGQNGRPQPRALRERYRDALPILLMGVEEYAREKGYERVLINPTYILLDQWSLVFKIHPDVAYRIYTRLLLKYGYHLVEEPIPLESRNEKSPSRYVWEKKIGSEPTEFSHLLIHSAPSAPLRNPAHASPHKVLATAA